MPTLMPRDTRDALGANAARCDSRSLLLDRFADPGAKDSGDDHPRRAWFNQLRSKPPVLTAASSRYEWLSQVTANRHGELLYAQLQSRLMVNMAGGVMENAGLCLDRFGLPYLPGSAVKGCARRAALAALHEWCETGQQPGTTAEDEDNLFKDACAACAKPAEMLAAIARAFGWCELDWKTEKNQAGHFKSDFAWACGHSFHAIWKDAAEQLAKTFNWSIAGEKKATPWDALPNFAGNVAFLAGYPLDLGVIGKLDGLPLELPELGKLELDVVTVHHKKYYAGPERPNDPASVRAWEHEWGTAPDIEEPVPIVFPAVAPGHVFAFSLMPIRTHAAAMLPPVRAWLACGLSTFGIGAKTNAGYGWFECSEAIQTTVGKTLHDRAERDRADKQRQADERHRKAEEAERIRQKEEHEAALAGLSGDERADKEIELLTEQQFDAKARAFCKEPKKGGPTEEQRKAIVRALRGPRLTFWQTFKPKATKGDLATVDVAIRQLSKAMKLGKMP